MKAKGWKENLCSPRIVFIRKYKPQKTKLTNLEKKVSTTKTKKKKKENT